MRLIGHYNELHYYIIDIEAGKIVCQAGNSSHDSQVYLSAEEGVGLEQMREFCAQTIKTMGEENSCTCFGVFKLDEDDNSPPIHQFGG